MRFFLLNGGKVLRREFLLEKIWGYDYIADTRTVDVHVRHLRQKIEPNPGNPFYIETIRRVGYRFRDLSD
jgi:two-component system alkaline phosphatase synthesis response regulator PhoP